MRWACGLEALERFIPTKKVHYLFSELINNGLESKEQLNYHYRLPITKQIEENMEGQRPKVIDFLVGTLLINLKQQCMCMH